MSQSLDLYMKIAQKAEEVGRQDNWQRATKRKTKKISVPGTDDYSDGTDDDSEDGRGRRKSGGINRARWTQGTKRRPDGQKSLVKSKSRKNIRLSKKMTKSTKRKSGGSLTPRKSPKTKAKSPRKSAMQARELTMVTSTVL